MPRRPRRAAAGALVAVAGLLAASGPASATFPGENGRLLVEETGPGDSDVWAVQPNGSGGSLVGSGFGPTWSPDGRRIATAHYPVDGPYPAECNYEDAPYDLFVRNGERGAPRPLGVTSAWSPSWSKDGASLTYLHGDPSAPNCGAFDEIWSASVDGSARSRLAASSFHYELERSPDGTRLAYGEGGIRVLNADGTGVRQLTTGQDEDPSWSPDGREIAFARWVPDLSRHEIRVVDVTTGTTRRLTTGSGPVWAPDGSSIAFDDADRLHFIDPAGGTRVAGTETLCHQFEGCDRSPDDESIGQGGLDWQPLPPGSNLVGNPSFERSTDGWGSFNGRLTRVGQAGAPDGEAVVRVNQTSGTKYSVSDSADGFSPTVPFSRAGDGYLATAEVRAASSSAAGRTIRLHLREKTPTGIVVQDRSAPTTLSSSVRHLAVAATATATGNSLGVRVEQSAAVPGDAFDADRIRLVKTRQVAGVAAAGSSLQAMTGDNKRASRFTITGSTAQEITHLRAYLDGKGGAAGTQVLHGVVHADASGAPGALRARSAAVTITAGRAAGWVDLAFTTPVRLEPGSHWLGLHSGATSGVARWAHSPIAGALRWNADAYGDGTASPFGTARNDDKQLSIRAVGG